MTPDELGLPEAPWYGARIDSSDDWIILETLNEAIDMLAENMCFSMGSDEPFEVAAFRDANEAEKAEDDYCEEENGCRIIGDPVKVKATVEVTRREK